MNIELIIEKLYKILLKNKFKDNWYENIIWFKRDTNESNIIEIVLWENNLNNEELDNLYELINCLNYDGWAFLEFKNGKFVIFLM